MQVKKYIKPIFSYSGRIILLLITLILLLNLERCATPSIIVTREQNQGDAYFNNHDYETAIVHYSEMLKASKKLGVYRNPDMESEVHRKIANCFEMMGNYESALSQVDLAVKLDSLNNNTLNLISDFRHRGKIFIYMGLSQNGISSLENSLRLSSGMDQSLKNINRLSIADTYLALGQLYSMMGKSDKALDFTEKALNMFRQAGDKRGEMESDLTLENGRGT